MTHKEKAEQLLHQQYHCSQALFGAYAEELGLDLKTAFKVSTCFGGGMRQGGTCGCITAALLVLGLAMGFYDAQDKERKYTAIRKPKSLQDGLRSGCRVMFFAGISLEKIYRNLKRWQ